MWFFYWYVIKISMIRNKKDNREKCEKRKGEKPYANSRLRFERFDMHAIELESYLIYYEPIELELLKVKIFVCKENLNVKNFNSSIKKE